MTRPLRVILYDRTQSQRPPRALGHSWRVGSVLYRGLARVDAAYGATSFAGAFEWLERYRPGESIGEVQFWGHGKWGRILIDEESLDRRALAPAHRLHARLEQLRERLAPGALLWFRTCETLGAQAGHDFARAFSEFLRADVAGHTHVIGFFQSGLHRLRAGARPHWSLEEGLSRGTPERPLAARASHPDAPNTITCLHGAIPAAFEGT